MESRPVLESHFGAWPMTVVGPDELVPLLETPGGGGAAPINWLRVILGLADRGPGRFVAWIVLAIGLAVTVGTWQYLRADAASDAQRELAHRGAIVVDAISNRLAHYQQALSSVTTHRAMHGGQNQEEWVEFVSRLRIEHSYPGIQAVAYASWEPIGPTATIELMYSLSSRATRMIGFDAYANPVLRETFDRAADSGTVALSGKFKLIIETDQPGFGMFLPDYYAGQPLYSVEGRGAAVQGFAFLIFRAHDFVRGLMSPAMEDVRFALFDGNGPDPARLLYDNVGSAAPSGEVNLSSPDLTRPLKFGGRTWTVAVFAPPSPGFQIIGRDGLLVAGILLSLILFAMTGALSHALERRKQANALLAKRARYRESYADLGRFALINGDLDAVIEQAFSTLRVIDVENCVLLEHLAATEELARHASRGWGERPGRPTVPLGPRTSAAVTLATGRSVVIQDTLSEKEFNFPPAILELGIRCSATVAVQDEDGPWGVLIANATRPNAFGSDEIAFLQTVANIIAEALRRRRANELLHQAQKMEAVGQLTGGIAHDFNNLLTVVMGNMELLLDDPGTPAGHRPGMEMTMQAARRGADLTQKMLAFSRRQPLRPQTIELDRIIPEMEGLLKRSLGEHIEIETHLPRDLWKTHVDHTQLETAILNLALNARDAMPNGGRLIIEAENTELEETFVSTNEIPRVGPYVSLTIADTGAGMTPDVLARVFEPFFTTKDVGKGSGLGLSMVYGFVRQSGGYVKIYSEEGHGTTVRLYLPRAEGEGETATAKDKPKLVRGHETVLVVEDDPLVRELAVGMISKLGYDVVVATNGKQALGILDSDRPIDLMFSDLVMPGGVSGAELAFEARMRRPGIKVLLTSGYSEHTVTKPGEEGLGFPLISKPYRASDLAQRIRAILDDGKLALDSVA